MAANLAEQKELEKLVGQLSEAIYAGKVMSLAFIFIDSNGNVQCSHHITQNQAVTMLGLTKLLDHNIAGMAIKAVEPKDYMEE